MVELAVQQTKGYYENYPFIEGGSERISWWQEYLREFLPDEDVEGRLIVDIGSSIGEITRGFANRGARMTCLDLTMTGLQRNQQINPDAKGWFNGSAINLPFADEAFDHSISIGVLMVTPDCRKGIAEIARVTAPGGTVVLFIYNTWSYLNLCYKLWAPVRKVMPLSKVPSWIVRGMQPFVKSHLGTKLDEPVLRRLLGDKLWTPHATFHTKGELERWARAEGLEPVHHKLFYHNYAHVMSFKKTGTPRAEPVRDILLRCLACGSQPIRHDDEAYRCDDCGSIYSKKDGIYQCLV